MLTKNAQIALAFLHHYPDTKLFPAIWKEGAHHGLIAWGENSSNNPEDIKQWAARWPHAYFCINRVKSNLVILDIDDKNGKEGSAGLQKLVDEHGSLPVTLISRTPSGGKHYIMKGAAATCIGKLADGIDIPVMVPLPASTVPGKGQYAIEHAGPISDAPPWIAERAGLPRDKQADRTEAVTELDQPHHIADAVMYLQTAPLAVVGSRDDTTYRVACRVRDFGIAPTTAFDLMLRFWYPRLGENAGDWSIDDMRLKVETAYRYAQTPIGSGTPEAIFDVLPEPAAIGRYDEDPGPKRADEYVGEPAGRDWIIDEWLPVGEISSLYGYGGLGKSLLAIQLGHAVSNGSAFLGLPVLTAMTTFGVFCEDADAELHRRLYSIRNCPETVFRNPDKPSFDFWLWSRAQRDNTLAQIENGGVCKRCRFYDILCDELHKLGTEPKLLILDVLADLFSGSETDREAANKFIKVVLGSFIRRYNCTVLLLAHPSVAQRTSGLSGSTAWNNAVRNRLVLEQHKYYDDYRILTRAKSNYSKSGESLNLMYDNGLFKAVSMADVVDAVEERNKDLLMEAICTQAAKGVPYGTHAQAKLNIYSVRIVDAEGREMSKATKTRLINEMVREGDIEHVKNKSSGNGLWPTGSCTV